jgi:hypothetical protein
VVRFFIKFFGVVFIQPNEESAPRFSTKSTRSGLRDGPRVVVWFRNLKAVLKVAR